MRNRLTFATSFAAFSEARPDLTQLAGKLLMKMDNLSYVSTPSRPYARSIKAGKVEALKDNIGVWRIADGQQPPPGVDLRRPEVRRPEVIMGPSQDDPGADHRVDLLMELADARQCLAAAEREAVLLRERLADERERRQEQVAELHAILADARAERDRMAELLHAALDRPSWLERLARAL